MEMCESLKFKGHS